jgi:hypothetical protein
VARGTAAPVSFREEDGLPKRPVTPLHSLRKSRASDISWFNTKDPAERTRPAREARFAQFLAAADGDERRARSLQRAHMKAMLEKSITVRAARKAAKTEAAGT